MKRFVYCAFLIGSLSVSICHSQGQFDARVAVGAQDFHPAPGSQMPPRIIPFMKILGRDHPGLGAYIVGLGDVNGDGYGDFAVSSTLDTTFIFFGGPNLDDQADGFVLGGGFGIVAGDINGDGYTDLVTAQYDLNHKLDPGNRGLVRVYLHNHTADPYNPQPDLQMVGKNERSNLARGGATHLLGCDVNGDGKMDLLIEGYNDKTPNGTGIVYLYLGSAVPDTIPDFQFMDSRSGEMRSYYGEKFAVTDLNKDGYDDILIQGMGQNGTNEEIYLGNPQAQFGLPYKDVNFQDPFNGDFPWEFVDIDGDHCDEIFPRLIYSDPPFTWGKCDVEFPKQTFLPDTVFSNPDPGVFGGCWGVHPLGHFNGSSYSTYVTHWAVPLIEGGMSNWIYQSGPGWQREAIAFFGTQALSDGLSGDMARGLGDVTGDNIDDFALICGTPLGIGYPIWIFKGDTKYRLTGFHSDSKPGEMSIVIYPNPVTSLDSRRMFIKGNLDSPSTVELTLYDLLGRKTLVLSYRMENSGPFQIRVALERLAAGQYFVSIRIGEKTVIRPLVLLSQ